MRSLKGLCHHFKYYFKKPKYIFIPVKPKKNGPVFFKITLPVLYIRGKISPLGCRWPGWKWIASWKNEANFFKFIASILPAPIYSFGDVIAKAAPFHSIIWTCVFCVKPQSPTSCFAKWLPHQLMALGKHTLNFLLNLLIYNKLHKYLKHYNGPNYVNLMVNLIFVCRWQTKPKMLIHGELYYEVSC